MGTHKNAFRFWIIHSKNLIDFDFNNCGKGPYIGIFLRGSVSVRMFSCYIIANKTMLS